MGVIYVIVWPFTTSAYAKKVVQFNAKKGHKLRNWLQLKKKSFLIISEYPEPRNVQQQDIKFFDPTQNVCFLNEKSY